ncbi:MAG: TolC family protein [Planctomycetota bacterium]
MTDSERSRRTPSWARFGLILVTGAVVTLAGCRSPLEQRTDAALRESIMRSVRRELAEAERFDAPLTTERESGIDRLEIREDLLEEVKRDYDPTSYFLDDTELDAAAANRRIAQVDELIGPDLNNAPTRIVAIGLQRVIRRAVENNLAIEQARLEPAITEADIVAAEAAFDWLFFANAQWSDIDQPQAGPGFLNLPQVVSRSQSVTQTTGVRRQLTTGGEVSFQQQLIYTDERESAFGVLPFPNPNSSATYTFGIDQPLLRGFGSDVTLAQVRLNRNAERRTIEQLRQTLIDTVTNAENAYWNLVVAHRELVISSRVLERGEQTAQDIKARRVLDAIQSQVANAVSTSETRRSAVITARNDLRRASDALKAIMNDPELPVGSEVMLVPADDPIDEPVGYSLADSIQTAIEQRPDLSLAVLGIDDASINEVVADNQRLPDLRASAELDLVGFDNDFAGALANQYNNEFFDNFLLGLFFEQPIGNRAAEAGSRRARLQRILSVVGYRATVQNAVLEVKNAVDDLVTNYRLIEQARVSRIAAGESVRSLLVEKELTDRGYSVERLEVELGRQDALANSERIEVQALVNYNRAIAELHRAMGTTLERNRIDFVVPDANQLLTGEYALDYTVEPEEPSQTDGEP